MHIRQWECNRRFIRQRPQFEGRLMFVLFITYHALLALTQVEGVNLIILEINPKIHSFLKKNSLIKM